ncbi:spherulation-specific family 4 protein [Trinickia fusca]|nr:spherulation-specific family 4 protein [Trinickia fusca]
MKWLIGGVAAAMLASVALPASARGIEVGLPAYVYPGDPFLTTLEDPVKTPVPPSVVIVNIGNGDADESILDHDADLLRARTAANGGPVKVIGYVHTDKALRSLDDIKASVDRYLNARNGSVHYDGIFFDEVPNLCGASATSTEWRDKLRAARVYVTSKLPGVQSFVVNNLGTAVPDCYLQAGNDTADVFITFEDTAAHYLVDASANGWAYGWVGGNIIANGQYASGAEYGPRFWHLVYNTGNADWATVVNKAFGRFAAYVDATDAFMVGPYLNPWTAIPSYLNAEIGYAGGLRQ